MSEQASTPAAARRPTLATVAATAGVSVSTASLAFAEPDRVSAATRDRVLAAAAALGYTGPDPRARSLRRGRSDVVGVVVEGGLGEFFRDPVNTDVLDGLTAALDPIGSSLLFVTDTLERPADLAGFGVDALVLIGCGTRLTRLLGPVLQRGIPVIGIETEPADGVRLVELDNREASAELARRLRELGHTRVGMLTLPLDPEYATGPLTPDRERATSSWVARERMAGVRDVFPDAVGEVAGPSGFERGRLAAHALLDREPSLTALIAQSDLLAAGALRAAEERGLAVPQTLSVVGFDGLKPEAVGGARLTTMRQPGVEKGRLAGEAVLGAVSGERLPPMLLRCEFISGATAAAPAAPPAA